MTPFMLADRGGCSFVDKVRNMEDAGAAVGIVVDSSDEDINEIIFIILLFFGNFLGLVTNHFQRK